MQKKLRDLDQSPDTEIEDLQTRANLLANILIDEYLAYVERPPRWELFDQMEDWVPPTPTGFKWEE